MMKTGALPKNILLFFFTLAFSLLAAEFALRLTDHPAAVEPEAPKTNWAKVPEQVWTEYHPQLGWFHEKNKKALLDTGRYTMEIQTNSMGLRGSREYTEAKPAGVTRILAIGDSFTFGFGVRETETFEHLIEQKHPDVEVLNFGVPGYGIDQMLMLYRSLGKKFQADYVLISLFPEDFWRDLRAFADSGHAKPYFKLNRQGKLELQNVPVPPKFALKTHQFPDLIEPGPFEKIFEQSLLYKRLRKAFLKVGIAAGLVDPDLSEEWILGRAILEQFIFEVRESGAEPVLMLVPPEGWARSTRKTSLQKSLPKFAARMKVRLIDPTPEFHEAVSSSAVTEYYIDGDWHWTAKGHALLSDILENSFSKRP